MRRIHVPLSRLVLTTAGAFVVAMFVVAAAVAKPPGHSGPHGKVACSQAALVAAIDAANSAGGGTLELAHRCDYRLTSSPDGSENGLPAITTAIKIKGNRATIDGTDSFRDFEVDGPGGSLSAHDLTITGGSVADFGGGIANIGGSVILDRVRVTGNSAGSAGGGIASATFSPASPATLTIRHSWVNDNQQTSDNPDTALGGGGIVNIEGTAKLDRTQVNGNTARGFVGGGIANGDYFSFSGSDSVLKLDHSRVNGNAAPNGNGGGIQNLLGSVTADHTRVNGNTSVHGGGIVSGNANGGSIGPAELKLSHSEVNRNTATAGPPAPGEGPPIAAGGISNGSEAVLNHTQVDGNIASQTSGAGIVNHGAMTLRHSNVNGNTAAGGGAKASGGGILNVAAPDAPGTGVLTLDHSKVDHNSAGGNGGGISNGLAPMAVGGDVTLKHSEVRHNSAGHGGGIFNNGGAVTLKKTKVTDNHPDNCEPTNSIAGCIN
jgi:predicted outer membrane repeat protein